MRILGHSQVMHSHVLLKQSWTLHWQMYKLDFTALLCLQELHSHLPGQEGELADTSGTVRCNRDKPPADEVQSLCMQKSNREEAGGRETGSLESAFGRSLSCQC